MRADRGASLRRLQELLCAADDAVAQQGIDLLCALDDRELWATLLARTRLMKRLDIVSEIYLNKAEIEGFSFPRREQGGLWVVLRLLAAAPPDLPQAAALKEQVVNLELAGRQTLDLSPLRAGYPRLERLAVGTEWEDGWAEGWGALRRLPALRELTLRRIQLPAPLSLPPLERLVLVRPRGKMLALPKDSAIDHVVAELSWGPGWTFRLPRTRALAIRSRESPLSLRLDAPALRELAVPPGLELADIGGLAEAPALEAISLAPNSPLRALPDLRRLTTLQQLSAPGCKALTDVSGLAGLPGLKAVDLRDCESLSDVSALADCPDLRVVVLHGTKVTPQALPPALRDLAVWAPKTVIEPMVGRPLPRRQPS